MLSFDTWYSHRISVNYSAYETQFELNEGVRNKGYALIFKNSYNKKTQFIFYDSKIQNSRIKELLPFHFHFFF